MVASANLATSKGFMELVGGLLFPCTLRFYDIMGEALFFLLYRYRVFNSDLPFCEACNVTTVVEDF